MNITVIGTGYVGLVTGACFAEMGNDVTCVDIDEKKVENLKAGVIPIYEPGLQQVVETNYLQGRLHFTTNLAEAMPLADALFIAVGTPPGEDGSADLQYVLAVAKSIGQNLNGYCVIVDKSTVPVGTADKVRKVIADELAQRGVDFAFDVVSNPEFLKEGAAVKDFMSPDRIVIGSDSPLATEKMMELYAPFIRNHPRSIVMSVRDAEMTKYAANALLATKISFMNEIARLCEELGADVENVRLGIGSDQRIGFHFIYPGAGYGGSCFPKDVNALVHMGRQIGFSATLLEAVEERNKQQKLRLGEKVVAEFGDDLTGRSFGVWGLSFKPGTDDMRAAPSIVLIHELLNRGAKVIAYDPVAMQTAKAEFDEEFFSSGALTFCEQQYDVANNADALILVTEWKPFRHPDFSSLKSRMKTPVIFDGRNQYDINQVTELGFKYFGIGRGSRSPISLSA